MKRISKIKWYKELCETIAKRSTCERKHYGAILVRNNRILTTGYNGAPPEEKHCLEIGCKRPEEHYNGINYVECRGIHAEWNCILQAAKTEVNIKGSTCYINGEPCSICRKSLKAAGVKEIYYFHGERCYDEEEYYGRILFGEKFPASYHDCKFYLPIK